MSTTTWIVGADVGWVSDLTTEAVYVALLPLEPALVLDGTAHVIWHAAIDGGNLEDVVHAVSAAAGVDTDVVRDETRAFLDDLVSRGLLRRLDA